MIQMFLPVIHRILKHNMVSWSLRFSSFVELDFCLLRLKRKLLFQSKERMNIEKTKKMKFGTGLRKIVETKRRCFVKNTSFQGMGGIRKSIMKGV